jgi:hypothetical protein
MKIISVIFLQQSGIDITFVLDREGMQMHWLDILVKTLHGALSSKVFPYPCIIPILLYICFGFDITIKMVSHACLQHY